MKKLIMNLPAKSATAYPILLGTGLLAKPEQWFPETYRNKRLVIITDDTVKDHYAQLLQNALIEQGNKPVLLSFPAGEAAKNYRTKEYLEQQMLAQHCGRDTVILALGGGVVGDLAGFTAATYMRGIPYIQLPTTLLAMVDSSIGGKTGIDTPQGKNLIGAFWQPTAVVADLDCLKTLSPTQLINGLIEAIKMFLTSDKTGLDYVQHNLEKIVAGDIEALSYVISHAIAIKIDVVQRDEKEQNLRMILNFGHTIGHALEKMTHYDLLHGYAVGLGILVEAKIAQLKGLLSAEDYHTIEMLLAELEITRDHLLGFDPKEIIQNTKSDKKTKHGHVNYILLEKLGKYHEKNAHVAHPIDDELVTQAFLTLREVYYGRE